MVTTLNEYVSALWRASKWEDAFDISTTEKLIHTLHTSAYKLVSMHMSNCIDAIRPAIGVVLCNFMPNLSPLIRYLIGDSVPSDVDSVVRYLGSVVDREIIRDNVVGMSMDNTCILCGRAMYTNSDGVLVHYDGEIECPNSTDELPLVATRKVIDNGGEGNHVTP